jgi:GNAT superfamily N-acetyltransferase
MNLIIKPLAPELAADYLDFFDNRAFKDREGAFCYCTWFHFDCSVKDYYAQGKDAMREQTSVYISNGKLNGYLAFTDNTVIGFCNADNKANYQRLKADFFTRNDSSKQIKSVVCFTVDPEYRGKGVAAALLTRIIADAQNQNYTAVESYPRLHDKHEPFDYAGPARLYEKFGFIEVARQGERVIMRKELNNNA